MNRLRAMASKAGFVLLAVLLSLMAVNYYVRVSDGDESHGVIEEKLFGESVGSRFTKLTQSENLRKWDEATKTSDKLVRIIREGKKDLLVDPKRDFDRINAHRLAARALAVSSSIPREYLAASHPDLPEAFSNNFVAAMAAFSAGFEKKDEALVADGVHRYDEFLRWIQSKRRDDFKPLR